ncbi:MAG: 8-amino-7-oxononanoate synthase [Opitutales bacterium]
MSEFSNDKLKKRLEKQCEAGLERRLPNLENRENLINLADNDYLGLSHHPEVKKAAQQAINEYGCSSSASPLITGYGKSHARLAERLADWYELDHVMIWNSGYVANQALFSVLPDKKDHVFADRHVHHSVIAGLLRSPAKFRRFPHFDLDCLEKWLIQRQGTEGNNFVVTESVFSMDGDSPDLMHLAELRERFGFVWIVDEAHALGWYGDRGTGLLEHRGLLEQADIVVGTLGKSLGSHGAYLVLRNKTWYRYLMNFAGEFIYSTYLPPAAAAAATQAIDLVCQHSTRRPAWHEGSTRFRSKLRAGGWEVPDGDSPVTPIILGSVDRTVGMDQCLRAGGVLAGMMRPPTIPHETSRLRFSLKANMNFDQTADQILHILEKSEL